MTTEFESRYAEAVAKAHALSRELAGPSLLERFARLPPSVREAFPMSTLDMARANYSWPLMARPKQNPPNLPPHRTRFWLGGRACGKSYAGSHWVRQRVEAGARSLAIIGPTLRDIERYQIVGEGGSDGVLSVFPPQQKPEYLAHKALIRFHTGAVAYVVTAEDPEFRGSNLDSVWWDEPAKCRYLETLLRNVEMSTRLRGPIPLEIAFTGTPLPLQVLREIVADPDTVTILMKQDENASNLDPSYLARMQRQYGGTRIGRQELEGEILLDNPDSLFQASTIDRYRVEDQPELIRVAVSVDPAQATGKYNDETGIIIGGAASNGHIYITGDISQRSKPRAWGEAVAKAYAQLDADACVVERNRGGDMATDVVRTSMERLRGEMAAKAMVIEEVYATKGKLVRAEPISALVEQGMVHIVGRMPKLETELTDYNPALGGESPNRYDAFVWLVHFLAGLGNQEPIPGDYISARLPIEQRKNAIPDPVDDYESDTDDDYQPRRWR